MSPSIDERDTSGGLEGVNVEELTPDTLERAAAAASGNDHGRGGDVGRSLERRRQRPDSIAET